MKLYVDIKPNFEQLQLKGSVGPVEIVLQFEGDVLNYMALYCNFGRVWQGLRRRPEQS